MEKAQKPLVMTKFKAQRPHVVSSHPRTHAYHTTTGSKASLKGAGVSEARHDCRTDQNSHREAGKAGSPPNPPRWPATGTPSTLHPRSSRRHHRSISIALLPPLPPLPVCPARSCTSCGMELPFTTSPTPTYCLRPPCSTPV